ncbi:MAG: Rossmann-like and DUF2520 domain-containing protein [Planctomycetota bacterium]
MTRGRLGLVGAGAVGPAVARLLRDAGWTAGTIASRRAESARAAVEFIGSGRATTTSPEAAVDADLLVLAVPDRAIGAAAMEIARAGTVKRGSLALHLSGALSSDVLAPLREAGASAGSLHPLQTFADSASAVARLSSSWLFFEGDEPERVRAVAEDLGGRPVPMDPSGKVLYHAGAAAACNLAVAMVDAGVRLFSAAGIGRQEALQALLPLLEGTVENLEKVGLPGALTGPVARGDVEVVRRHLAEIGERAPDLLIPYAAASLHAVRVGLEKGTLGEAEAAAIESALSEATGGAVS